MASQGTRVKHGGDWVGTTGGSHCLPAAWLHGCMFGMMISAPALPLSCASPPSALPVAQAGPVGGAAGGQVGVRRQGAADRGRVDAGALAGRVLVGADGALRAVHHDVRLATAHIGGAVCDTCPLPLPACPRPLLPTNLHWAAGGACRLPPGGGRCSHARAPIAAGGGCQNRCPPGKSCTGPAGGKRWRRGRGGLRFGPRLCAAARCDGALLLAAAAAPAASHRRGTHHTAVVGQVAGLGGAFQAGLAGAGGVAGAAARGARRARVRHAGQAKVVLVQAGAVGQEAGAV